eukprot:CAMPEP_0198314456 /NCGR_PEP_ID=MMETSP1450-20131203/5079_1 /TAXON_ID=753684 ORGANISM="Madagascaria erythrocladiodes, Strain CCMP3234" /NCGR_SAMPLE_ID=MMETSP1450 /ASSEMBLY_ACC=CAM_ASM_001115 /LENGTH=76 /DNA_ID=CAMNT_0044017501 /DNA_START=836 /DNA_END=1066 /DNA_ORIENTATION=-
MSFRITKRHIVTPALVSSSSSGYPAFRRNEKEASRTQSARSVAKCRFPVTSSTHAAFIADTALSSRPPWKTANMRV